MAHSSSKFVSVNLNKSYGQRQSSSSSSSASSPAAAAAAFGHGRARPAAAGMVVLGRPRSSGSAGHKGPSKLSVPPPLNLPSLRKEYERLDPSLAAGSSARPGSSGIGSGSGSSTMGWTKPALLPDREVVGVGPPVKLGEQRAGSAYMPPSARTVGQPPLGSSRATTVEKAVFLRGEDFPSLHATVTPVPKQKDSLKQKQRQSGEDSVHGRTERPELQTPLDMRPQMRTSPLTTGSVIEKNRAPDRPSVSSGQPQKQDGYFPGPLPIVRLSHTSDWGDDERDTGLSIPERDRGFSRTDSGRDAEGINGTSREFFRGDSFRRDMAAPSKDIRDVSSWRSPQPRDGYGLREIGVDRDRVAAKPFVMNREMGKESNYSHSSHVDNSQDGFGSGVLDTQYSRREMGPRTSIQNGRNGVETYNGRAADHNQHGRYVDLSNNRYRGDAFQNSKILKNSFSSGSKGFSLNDPILNFGRDKRLISDNGKPYLDDGGLDSSDPFSGGSFGEMNVKVLRRKKDVLKQADFHDPVRESFEAELERVQRMQEMERQRVMEEQARVLELARREQEERERLVREEEERRRRLEEEAREAAWRVEQEKLEATRRAEVQKNVREEEKKRIFFEEERRKEAARKKLLELEARIAKRQAEGNLKDDRFPSSVSDERLPVLAKEREALRAADIGEWEDGERMVEHITSTAPSDSPSMNRYFDTGSRPHSLRDGNFSFMERGKHANNWRRDTYDNGNNTAFVSQDQDNEYHSPRRDSLSTTRGFSRKEAHVSLGPPARPLPKGVTSEALQVPDDFRHSRHRWNIADGEYFNRNADIDADFLDNDKFGDAVWAPGHSRGSPHASYAERSYQNSDVDGLSTFGRSRQSLRQPRVLPPPSVSSMHRSPFRAVSERPSSSSFLDSEVRYQHTGRAEEASYDSAYLEKLQQPATAVSLAHSTVPSELKVDKNGLRCDSQSSLSVSSPPASPTHLSHEDLDESEGFQTRPTSAVEEHSTVSDNENIVSTLDIGDTNIMLPSSSVSHGEDDEWATEDHETVQEQEEYDEDGDGYQEEDEAHDGNAENLDIGQELEDIHSEVLDTSGEGDQIVLGFDEGVQVNIPITDEFEKASTNNEIEVGVYAGSVSAATEPNNSDGHRMEAQNPFLEGSAKDSSKIIEIEKALPDLVLDPGASMSYTLDGTEGHGSSDMRTQESVSSALSSSSMPFTSSAEPMVSSISTSLAQLALSSVSTVSTQPEVPIKLQFGLFSSPPLIPSPIPAIQIGSIQMPLHLRPQVGPSITQMNSSQAPLLQFGQLRYTSPISQGILPLAHQTITFVQPPTSTHYSLNQNLQARNRERQESSSLNNSGNKAVSARTPIDKQPGLVTKPACVSQNNVECGQMNALPDPPRNEVASQTQTGDSSFVEVRSRYTSASQSVRHGIRDINVKKSYRPVVNNIESHLHAGHNPSQFFSAENVLSGSKAGGMVSGCRGKRFIYNVRNVGSRTLFSGPDGPHTDTGGFQRRARRNIRRSEFRVRENSDKRQTEVVESFNSAGQDRNLNFNGKVPGNSGRYGGKKDAGLSKLTKTVTDSENLNSGSPSPRVVISDVNMDKVSRKDTTSKKRMPSVHNFHAGEEDKKRNDGSSEEDVDAPLQSNIVRVFKQPGIEAPSDDDDFIQVRSKRQMLNDRREQREKEIKAKSRAIKASRKTRAVPQSNAVTSKSIRALSSLSGQTANIVRSGSGITDERGFANVEASPMFTANNTSQSLPPIGTPSPNVNSNSRSKSLKSSQTSTVPVVSSGGTKMICLPFENNNGAFDNASMPLASWGNVDINQQVMALTQSQLDEAMQPARFDSHASSSIAHEPTKPSETFSCSANPLTSLLAGEKIQFGAVTSTTILPPVSRAMPNGIGRPGSGRSEIAMAPKLPAGENDCAVFFDKEKRSGESCANLEDPEAEAEAAASAVAVAVISNNDEIVGNRLSACAVSVSETKNFTASDATTLTSKGITGSQDATGQSAAEDSLAVSLPADLSVDTPSLPLWPPLPRPQSSSGPMLSHFPGAPPSHFPCFEMNPMLGGAIFAFGPHDESAGTQAQPQRSTTLGSGPLGAWPQCHPTMDSFYGPPTGFTGPFISPPGGIPGVQGPPHMVVYNHFTPVGQFGQVGLSFMGTTYIPTGKQPDWKHSPISSAMGVGENVASNLNVVSGPRNPSSMPTPIQHLAPGAPLMPMASPLTMFDMPPFQSSADVPLQARWSHMPVQPIHSVPLSMPLQQHQVEGMTSQFSRGLPMDTSGGNNRFHEPRLPTVTDGNRSLSVPKNAAPQFPDDLGLVERPSTTTDSAKTSRPSGSPVSGNIVAKSSRSSARSTIANASESGGNGGSSSNSGGQMVGSTSKPHAPQQPVPSGQQYLHGIRHADQRGVGASQKAASGGEWHRQMGYQGRNQTSGPDKNFASSKVKQVYVAKSSNGNAATG